jgi:hypothetical protein
MTRTGHQFAQHVPANEGGAECEPGQEQRADGHGLRRLAHPGASRRLDPESG